jgi:hypothetical protein
MSTGFPPTDPLENVYDPELPFLEALEREVRRNALRAARRHEVHAQLGTTRREADQHRATQHGVRRHGVDTRADATTSSSWQLASRPARRSRGHDDAAFRGVSRIARRSLILVGLLFLIGASAYGAREIFSGGASNLAVIRQGPLAVLGSGHAGDDRWSLSLYRREGELCRVLVVSENESSRCSPAPGRATVALTSVVSPLRRYVFGVTGGDVAQVSLRVGGNTQVVPTRVPDSASARAAGLSPGTHWFIAILDRPTGNSNPPAIVRGLDAESRPLGPAHVSCIETAEPQQCR